MLKIMFCSLYPLDAPICVMAIFSSHRLGYWIASTGLCHPCSYQWREKRSEILVRIFANTNRAETTVALIFHCRLKCQSMKILVALQLHTPCWKFGLLVNCAEMSKQIRGAGFCNGRSQKGWGACAPLTARGRTPNKFVQFAGLTINIMLLHAICIKMHYGIEYTISRQKNSISGEGAEPLPWFHPL